MISKTTFDIEPKRFILSIPTFPVLNVDLNTSTLEQAKTLSAERELDVDGAKVEWHVKKSTVEVAC
jgi:hypothetical protein